MNPRLALLLPLALAVTAILWWLPRPPAPEPAASDTARVPRYALTGATWIKLDASGQPQFRAQAAQIDMYGDGSADLRSLHVDALGGLDSPWQLQAPSGFMPPRQKRLRLNGPVTGEGRLDENEPAQLSAEQIWIDPVRREFSSDRPVRLQSARRWAQAHGLRADFAASRIELRGNVEAHYAPD